MWSIDREDRRKDRTKNVDALIQFCCERLFTRGGLLKTVPPRISRVNYQHLDLQVHSIVLSGRDSHWQTLIPYSVFAYTVSAGPVRLLLVLLKISWNMPCNFTNSAPTTLSASEVASARTLRMSSPPSFVSSLLPWRHHPFGGLCNRNQPFSFQTERL